MSYKPTTDTNSPPSPGLVREAVQAFADSLGSGWKVYDQNDSPYAGRRFEYRSGARALLAVLPFDLPRNPQKYMNAEPLDLVWKWEAQINVPFAAGAELSTIGKLAAVQEWVAAQEKVLKLPLKLQECKTREAAETMAAGISGGALVLLGTVFDIDTSLGRKHMVQELAKACVPGGRS